MYAYVDETGNTGAHLLDDDQPLFITAALMTRSDFDARFSVEVAAIAKALGVDEIHANRLGVGRIEEVASDILKVVRKAGPAFFLARVEKRYVIASKIVDTLFDSAENRAVAWHVFNMRSLRLMLVFKIASLLDDGLARSFWDALMEKGEARARAAMAGFCRSLGDRVPGIVDERSREVVSSALEWAVEHPEALEFVHQSKIGRKGHLPNMVGFGNLIAGIERQSDVWKVSVDLITHDRQNEFGPALRFWHGMFANALDEAIELPFGERYVPRKVFGSRFELSMARDSAGLQIVDVVLWLFARTLRGDELPAGCQRLLDYVYSRCRQDDFSFAGVGVAAERMIADLEAVDLPPGRLEEAKALYRESEERRIEAMEAYSRASEASPRDRAGG